jgi:hypothetical protein
MKRTARIERRNSVVCAYAIALGADFANPAPPAMAARAVRAALPDVTESEILTAVRWAIRKSKRDGARFERALRGSRGRPPRLKVVETPDVIL